jgi:excinuclease ABC subunit A
MHVRVLLSKYRSYTPCPTCRGARLKPDALLWKIEHKSIQDLMLTPIVQLRAFADTLKFDGGLDAAMEKWTDEGARLEVLERELRESG